MQPTELRTERLLLRPFRMEDVEDVLAYGSDEAWQRYVAIVPQPYTRDDAVEWCELEATRDWSRDAVFAIEYEGTVVGATNLMLFLANEMAELGYGMASRYWGQGIMPEAVTGLLDWAFPTYGLAKVAAKVDTRNERSWRMVERLGMTREGHLRKATLTHQGDRRDEFVYGLLREEWG